MIETRTVPADAPADARTRIAVVAGLMLFLWLWFGVSVRAVNGSEEAPASREVLRRGRAVYEASCGVCHGSTGDGNGMAAHMFRVPPRDFRRGLFKFRSTPSGSLPTDDDLLRTVSEGVRWTGMVGRPDLSEAGRRAVVAYLTTLSPRFARERAPSPVRVPPAPPKSPELLAQAAGGTKTPTASDATEREARGTVPRHRGCGTTGGGRPGRGT